MLPETPGSLPGWFGSSAGASVTDGRETREGGLWQRGCSAMLTSGNIAVHQGGEAKPISLLLRKYYVKSFSHSTVSVIGPRKLEVVLLLSGTLLIVAFLVSAWLCSNGKRLPVL